MRAIARSGVITFVLAENSHPLFHRIHAKLSAAVPSMGTVRVPAASHLLPMEAPATLAAIVGDVVSNP